MDVLRQLWAIALVLGLLWAALWALRKRGAIRFRQSHAPNSGVTLISLARLTLGPQHSLHWVRIGARDVLVAVHPSGITSLGDVAPSSPGVAPAGRLER